MYTHVEKPKKNESRAVANSVAQKKGNVRQGFGFNDKMPIYQMSKIDKSINIIKPLIQMQPMDEASIRLAIQNDNLVGAGYLTGLYSLEYRHHNDNVIFLRSNRATLDSDANTAIRWYRCMTSAEFDKLNRNNRFYGDTYGGIAPQATYARQYLTNNSAGSHVVEFTTPNDGYLFNLFTNKGPGWQIKAEGGGTFGLGPTGNEAGEAGAVFNNLLARRVISWELVDLRIPNPNV